MTKLSYKVGSFETTSYQEAIEMAKETGYTVERKYTPIAETTKVKPEERAKAFAALCKGLGKRAH